MGLNGLPIFCYELTHHYTCGTARIGIDGIEAYGISVGKLDFIVCPTAIDAAAWVGLVVVGRYDVCATCKGCFHRAVVTAASFDGASIGSATHYIAFRYPLFDAVDTSFGVVGNDKRTFGRARRRKPKQYAPAK